MMATRKGETAGVESFKEKVRKRKVIGGGAARDGYYFDSYLRPCTKGWSPKRL
jgi:hypothetical protein